MADSKKDKNRDAYEKPELKKEGHLGDITAGVSKK